MKDSAVIIVAAGAGKRFGSKTPKQFLLLNKLPVFLWSVQAFRKVREFSQFVAVVPADMLGTLAPYRKKYGIDFVAGGKERFDSVKAGLQALRPGIGYVAIHDGARPLITPEIIRHGVNGLLVPPRDAESLASALINILTHPETAEQFGKAGREIIREHFSVDRLADETLDVYYQVLSGGL
jgi:2-C-methyl-D-erythritol 4-phosphate cytidylyltransferase